MPTERGRDGKGPFMRWGSHGKKYRYTAGNKSSRNAARRKADRQGRAARARGFRGR